MVKKKALRKKKKPQIVTYIVLIILAFLFVYPFWQTLVISFSDSVYANAPGFKFWPKTLSLAAYQKVFGTSTIYIGYMNTLIRTAAGASVTLLITFCAAYTMAHRNLPGWSFFNFIVVFTMFFSGGLIPAYLNLKSLHLLNTRWVLILPGAAGAWNLIIMRNFLSSISKELEDAARIDGAGAVRCMLSIYLPNSRAILAVIGLWSVVSHWNAWFDSMIYANKAELVVLQTVIRRLIDSGNEMAASGNAASMADMTPATVRAATVMVATLPILLGYPFIQKYLVKGTMVGAVKG